MIITVVDVAALERSRDVYARELARRIRAGTIPVREGAPVSIEVRHDEWCRAYQGHPCNCRPEIEWRAVRGSA